ncbi:MAG: lipocalin family protein [Bacteroidales bacterium]|nr:lipocalin family protein [Bacteroidales bacterium]
MKKAFSILTLFVVIASMASLTSCTKDNESGIVGTWKCTSAVITYDDGEVFDATGFIFNDDVEFKADGTFYMEDEYEGDYTVSGSTLVLYAGTADEEVYTIKKLTGSALELEAREIDEEDPDFSCTYYLKFTRA